MRYEAYPTKLVYTRAPMQSEQIYEIGFGGGSLRCDGAGGCPDEPGVRGNIVMRLGELRHRERRQC